MPVIVLATLGLLRPAVPESMHGWLSLTPGAAVNDVVRVAWFGRTTDLTSSDSIGFVATWGELAPALAVLAAWAVLALLLARHAMRWEPRT
jgi:ABC-2 type transport system permease protein